MLPMFGVTVYRAFADFARHGHVSTYHPRKLARDDKSKAANCCAVEASGCVNSSNSLPICSVVMPIPLSATASSIHSPPPSSFRSRSDLALQALLSGPDHRGCLHRQSGGQVIWRNRTLFLRKRRWHLWSIFSNEKEMGRGRRCGE
jgi:hypothetical protein